MHKIIKITLFCITILVYEKSHASVDKSQDFMYNDHNLTYHAVEDKLPSLSKKIFAASIATTAGVAQFISMIFIGSYIGGFFGPHYHHPDLGHRDGFMAQGFLSGMILGIGTGLYIGNLVYSDLTSAPVNRDAQGHRSKYISRYIHQLSTN